jgi:hypothetical protein
VKNHTCFYFTAIGKLQKRIHDPHPIKHLAVMHVLTKKYATARTLRTTKMERVKIRESVQAVNINSGKNIRHRGLYQRKLGIKLQLAARNAGIQVQLPHGGRKILPEHWNGNHGSLPANMRFYKVCRNRLLARVSAVIPVNEHIGVKKSSWERERYGRGHFMRSS